MYYNQLQMGSSIINGLKKLLSFIPFLRDDMQQDTGTETAPAQEISRIEALKTVNEESNRIISWALLIIGGSILAILQKDYLKLNEYKWLYFVYILGWIALCISIYWGQRVTRSYLASMFVIPSLVEGISEETNKRFKRQLTWFMGGVAIFAVWMITFLTIWIFNGKIIT
ncbi:hypothetical protein M2273_002180 [Mucilaginibacter lappiensis]